MSTKRQLRSENIKEKKIKKSTRLIYLAVILGGGFIVLVIFFVILFSAIFPPVDMDAMKKKEKYIVKIYFSNPQELFLKPEKRYVFKEKNVAEQAKEIVKAVLDGSKTGLVDTFPKKVTVKDVKVTNDGIAEVSFSKELIKGYEGSSASEMATIYSLTDSLSQNIPEIKKVKIMVEGKEIPTIKGHISTRKAFSPDLELISSEKTE
jgi:hypothetical protein